MKTLGKVVHGGIVSTSELSTDQDDLAIGAASVLRYNCGTAHSLTGIAGGEAGRMLILSNVGDSTLTLESESASSTAANRLSLDMDAALEPGSALEFIYDGVTARWVPISMPGGDSDVVSGFVTAADTSDAVIPNDNTIPQNTEGKEIVAVNVTVKTGQLVDIKALAHIVTHDGPACVALFRSGQANALATAYVRTAGGAAMINSVPIVYTDSPSAGTYTYSLRYGPLGATPDVHLNSSDDTPTAFHGGVARSGIIARPVAGGGGMSGRNLTVSTSDPSGGNDGDLWLKYEA